MVLSVFASTSNAQCPSVTISTPLKSYCLSDFIELNATNIPNNSIVEWNLGDGWDTATTKPYYGATTIPGKLNVDLRITLSSKKVCTYSAADLATIFDLPKTDFKVSRRLLCSSNDTLVLKDITPTSVSRNWKLGTTLYDNTNKETTVKIPADGSYSLSLVTKDANGCINTKDVKNYINVYDDIELDFSKSNNSNCYPITTNYTSKLKLNRQTVKSYSWDIPGSTQKTASTQNLSNISYPNIGKFNSTLTVTTDQGCTYTNEKVRYISLGDKVTLNVTASKQNLCLSEKVRIKQTIQPLPGSFDWGFTNRKNINKHEIEVFFKDTGQVDLNLKYNHNQCFSYLKKSNFIKVKGLKADFESKDALHCESPHTVHLKNISDTSSAKIKGYKWSIVESGTTNELTNSTSKNFDVTIKKAPSEYDVILITTSVNGCSDTTIKKSFIKIQPYDFNFYAVPDIGCKKTEFSFTNKTISSSYYGFDLYSWDFYDKDKLKILGSSASVSPKYTYKDTGYFHVQLTAANPLGCQEKHMKTNAVRIIEAQLDYNWKDSVACANDSFHLRSASKPSDPRLTSKYRFVHRLTKQNFTFEGDSIKAVLPEPGPYDVSYQYNSSPLCNDSIKHTFWVNGLTGTIKLDITSGCTPLEIKPTFNPTFNYHVGNPSSDLTYFWDVFPKTGVKIFGASTPNPKVVLDNGGTYKIALYATNSTGCLIYVESQEITSGLQSRVQANIPKTCIGDTVILFNKSTNTPSYLKWSLSDPTKARLDSVSFDTRELIATDSGIVQVELIASKNGTCVDTFTYDIDIAYVKANFETKDTSLSCSPAKALFINKSELADTLIWNFGDGQSIKTSAKDSTIHEYLSNSDADGFDVSLVAKTTRGCTDTFTDENLIKIKGPLPQFEITDSTGCEPIVVKFKNTSANYKDFYFDYGDGSKPDTNKISSRQYSADDVLIHEYFPRITVEDANGCKATSEKIHKIEVYSYPEKKIVIKPDTIVCQREKISIQDTGKFGRYYNWYLDDVLVSTKKSDTISTTEPGITKLKVSVANRFGCKDTFYQDIHTKMAAKLDFSIPEFLCLNESINFEVTLQSAETPKQYIWDFGEATNPNNIQNTSINKASITYLSTGKKTVEVIAVLDNGCAIPNTIEIEIYNTDDTPDAELLYVGFNDQNEIELNYPALNFDYFDQFKVYRNSSFLKNEGQNGNNQVIDATADLNIKNCYAISILDQCAGEGNASRSHCPVNLTLSSTVVGEVDLSWTYYVGWDRVERYDIYRAKEGEAYSKIAEVFNTQKDYTDKSGLCNATFRYKVVAVNLDDQLYSNSNYAEIVPQFEQNITPLNIKNVSVLENQSIKVTWEASKDGSHKSYLILKYENSLSNLVDQLSSTNTSIIDTDVNTSEFNYFYEVIDVDFCDNQTPKGRYGKSVLLQGLNVEGQNSLVWNAYEQADVNIKEHHIEFVRPNEKIHLKKMDPSTFIYEDGVIYQDIDGFFPFRVYTIHSNNDTAYSNIAKVTGEPIYYVPNSFSPNDDGKNEQFELYTLFISNDVELEQFDLKIFNRWGNKVFESNDLNKKWDGKYEGKDLPEGAYIYRVKLTASNGQLLFKNGTIHLIR